jgi:hypothetical protein
VLRLVSGPAPAPAPIVAPVPATAPAPVITARTFSPLRLDSLMTLRR